MRKQCTGGRDPPQRSFYAKNTMGTLMGASMRRQISDDRQVGLLERFVSDNTQMSLLWKDCC